MSQWSELHGEEKEMTGSEFWAQAREARQRNKFRVYCRNCQDFIYPEEMKAYRKDDDTVDMLCPGCDAVLVEGE